MLEVKNMVHLSKKNLFAIENFAPALCQAPGSFKSSVIKEIKLPLVARLS